LAAELAKNEGSIVAELNAVQGSPVDIGGYYKPEVESCAQAMRPSGILNRIVDSL